MRFHGLWAGAAVHKTVLLLLRCASPQREGQWPPYTRESARNSLAARRRFERVFRDRRALCRVLDSTPFRNRLFARRGPIENVPSSATPDHLACTLLIRAHNPLLSIVLGESGHRLLERKSTHECVERDYRLIQREAEAFYFTLGGSQQLSYSRLRIC